MMLRRTVPLLQKMRKQRGRYDLKTSLVKTVAFEKARKFNIKGETSGESLQGRGVERRRTATGLKEALGGMEHPAVWIWYPWRKNPEPPMPGMPLKRALKNVHGAVYTGLSPVQQRRHEELFFSAGFAPPATRDETHAAKHPFLQQVLNDLDGSAKGFPFWFKKYPTRRHAYTNRFNVPSEMLEGYSADIVKAIGPTMMANHERLKAQKAVYSERFAAHDFDTDSLPVKCVNVAIACRDMRNHLLTNPHNTVWKYRLATAELSLSRRLSSLRRVNFRQYWAILRDHDVQDLIQPHNNVRDRLGAYWRRDWSAGLAIKTNIADFMDPRGLSGCHETGRSRAEVARDLGLSYTRPLTILERARLGRQAAYYDNLAKFKTEQPEKSREMDRLSFIKKFTGMFATMNRYSAANDFPSTFRSTIGTKVLRWRTSRHGPM